MCIMFSNKSTYIIQRNGTIRVPVDSFKFLSLTEIWVARNKIRHSSNLNELLRDRIMNYAIHNSPQVVRNPYSGFRNSDTWLAAKTTTTNHLDRQSISTNAAEC